MDRVVGEEDILRARKRSSERMATALTKRIATIIAKEKKVSEESPELEIRRESRAHRRRACRDRKAAYFEFAIYCFPL